MSIQDEIDDAQSKLDSFLFNLQEIEEKADAISEEASSLYKRVEHLCKTLSMVDVTDTE